VDTYLRQSDGTYKAPSGVFNQLTYHPGANPRYTLKFQGEDYWQFDDRGKLVMMVDDHSPGDDPARDNLLTLDYAGPEGRLSRITAPGGRSVNVSWEGGHISSLAGPEGKTVSFNYQDGNLVQVTDIYGGATRYTYDEHRLTSMVEPEGNQVKRIEYYPPGDPNEGLVKKTIDAFGNETAFAYAVTAHETLITDPEGYTTTHRYDALYRLIQEVDNQGNSTIYCYGEDGNGKSIRDPEGRVTEFLSERGRVRRIVAPDGGVRSYDYDSLDRVIKEVNEEGSAKEFHYDERNNLAWETDFSGARTDYFYTDPANPGLPTFKVRPPLDSQQRPTTQFVYEANGDLKEEILYEGWIGDALHPAGVSPLYRKVFTYDGMGRKVLEVICDPLDPGKKQEFSYSYDDDVTDDGSRGVTRANLSYEVNGCHPEEVTRYDRNGRVKESLTFRGEEGRIAWVKTAYSYDGNDRETERMLFTSPDPQASGFVQVYQPMAKSYLKNGFVASESDYSGRLVAYRYDQTGRVAEQENQEGHITTFSYFRDGKVRERKDPFSTGSVIFNYDAAGRESVVTRNLQTLEGTSLTYTTRKVYNRRGNVITEEVVRVDPSDPGNPALFRMIRTSYQYDKEERLIRVVRPVEPLPGEVQVVTTYTYDNLGNKTSETITSPGSPERKTTWEYNALGKVVAERRFCSFIDSQGRVTTEVYVTWYTYDFLGNVVAETVTSGEGALAPVLSHRRYAYNGLSRVEGVYVALGDEANDFSLGSFEGVNNLPLQEVATYRYYCDGLLSWEVRRNLGSPDQQVSYSYDALGKKTGESLNRGDGVSFLKAYSYDGSGNLLSESIGSEGELRTTAYAYDLAGRLTRKVLPPAYPGEPEGQRAYTVNYLDEERARVETDPEGRSIRRTFDDLGREELTEGPGDYYALVAYDEAGRIVSQRVRLERREGDDTFKVTLSRYDDLGRKKSETTIGPAGEEFTTSFAYDAGGNLTSLTTPEGNLTRYYYDSLGRLRLQSLPHDAGTRIDTEFRYDALGRKTLVLQGGTDATRFTYDGLSHLRKVEQWAGPWDEQLGRGTGTLSETRYQYDLAGSLLAQTDAEGHTTAFSYNGCGWLTGVVDPLGRRQSYSYTPQGEMGSRSFFDPESGSPARTLFFSYDGRGRLKEKGARSPSGAELEKISYFYDRSGNLTRATEGTRRVELSWDGAGRLASVSSIAPEDSYQTSFAWYDSGELASRSGPQGTTTYSYDGAGRLAGIHDETGSYALSWDRDGRLISLDLPGGAHLEYNYYADGLFRTQEAYSPAAERQARFSFSYDRRGKRVAMSVELAGNPQGINGDYTYSYDCMGRIVGFSPPPALGAPETYSYDRVGNRVEVTRGGESKTYSYDSACQLVSCSDGTTYAYDLFGNLVSETKGEDEESYSYDPLLRLSSFRDASGEVAFSYDSLGRMARRAKGEEALLYRYDGSSFEPIQELDSQGETLSSFTLALDGTPLAERGTEGTSFLALNPHSDLAFALSSSGLLKGMKIYSPWGEELASTLPSPLGFQHDYTDPDSGLVFMQARWYSPELSSFLSPDPKPGEPTDPLGRNPYPYCSDDPVNRLDPTGETPRELMMMLRNPRAALYLLRHPELMTVIMLYQPGMSPAYASFVKKTVARVAARRMAARSRALRGNELPPPTQLSPAAAGIAGGGDRPRGVLPYPPGQAAKRHPC
jgi:RHS repeat-associated protein